MFTRRAVVLAAVPAALLLTGVVDGHRTACADEYTAPVQAALKQQAARTAAYREQAAQYRKKTEHYQGATKQEEEITRCGRFLLEHGGAKAPVTRENVCPMAREVAKDQGLAFPAPSS